MESGKDWNTQTVPAAILAEAFQQTGTRNPQGACADALLIREAPGFCFYGLADGQTGSAREGGRVCLNTVSNVIRRWGIGATAAYPFPDELPCLLMRKIRKSICSLARQRGVEVSDYASTLLALAVSPVTGQYVLAHLGSGCAVGVWADNAAAILSPPGNPAAQQFTTSPTAVRRLRLGFGTVDRMKRVVLLTDGAYRLCSGKNISRKAKALLAGGTQAELRSYLEASKPADDASCIVLDFAATLKNSSASRDIL